MDKKPAVRVIPLPGFRSTARALACLMFDGDETVNAWSVFQRIDNAEHRSGIEERNKITARFRHWVSGLKRDEYHHGWDDDPEFAMGYVFRWDHQRQHRRLYGCLVSPRPGLEVCVLCCFRSKDTYQTQKEVKRIVRSMSQHPEVKEAIKRAFGRKR